VVWILYIKPAPPPPFYLSIAIPEYNVRQYSPLLFTKQDYARISRHFPQKNLPETKTKDLLVSELKGLSAKTDPVLIHLTALAVVRDDKIFVIPGDADPDEVSTWLEIGEVIKAVGACPAGHKMLVLDLSHPIADARLGVLNDRVAQAMEDRFKSEKPGFWVITACAPGQFALSSETLQGSVLAYYLDQALQGYADVDKDQRVTVKELFAFVEARVDAWAQNILGRRQKPRLYGGGEDFFILGVGRSSLGEMEATEAAAYPEKLTEGWKARDAWWDKEAFGRAPRMLGKFESALARQDTLIRGGVLQKKDLDAPDDEPQLLLKDLTRAMIAKQTPPRSLALALSQEALKKDAAFIDAVLNIVANARVVTAKKDINVKVEEELSKKLREPKDVQFAQQAWAVLETLNRLPVTGPNPLHADQFRVVRQILGEIRPTKRYVDQLYIDRLLDFAERKDADYWHAKRVQGILQTLRAREIVIASLDREPGLLPWIGPFFEDADNQRRAAEKKLLWEGASTWDDAFEKLQAAKDKYEDALRLYEILHRGRLHLDRAFAELPSYARLICDGPEVDAQGEQLWRKSIDEAERLQVFFAAPPKGNPATRDDILRMDTPGRDLQKHLLNLEKSLRRRVEFAEKEDSVEGLRTIEFLLQSPLLKSSERAALLTKRRTLGAKLNDANDQQDKDDNRQGRVSPLPDAGATSRAAAAGLARARMTTALLRLAGIDTKHITLPASADDWTSSQWTAAERKIQEGWSKALLKQWQEPKSALWADAVNRLVSPWTRDRTGGLDKDYSVMLQKSQRDAFRAWLRQRYQAEAAFLQSEPYEPARTFFADAARELAN
jgi:hypothetical protein